MHSSLGIGCKARGSSTVSLWAIGNPTLEAALLTTIRRRKFWSAVARHSFGYDREAFGFAMTDCYPFPPGGDSPNNGSLSIITVEKEEDAGGRYHKFSKRMGYCLNRMFLCES